MALVCNGAAVQIVFTGRKIFSSFLKNQARGRQSTRRSLSPRNGDFVRHHEEQGVVSLAEQRYGNEPRVSSVRSLTEMTCSAWGGSSASLPL